MIDKLIVEAKDMLLLMCLLVNFEILINMVIIMIIGFEFSKSNNMI